MIDASISSYLMLCPSAEPIFEMEVPLMKMNFGALIGLLALTMFFIDPGTAHASRPIPVPEPATLSLLASGAVVLGAIGLLRRRKK